MGRPGNEARAWFHIPLYKAVSYMFVVTHHVPFLVTLLTLYIPKMARLTMRQGILVCVLTNDTHTHVNLLNHWKCTETPCYS